MQYPIMVTRTKYRNMRGNEKKRYTIFWLHKFIREDHDLPEHPFDHISRQKRRGLIGRFVHEVANTHSRLFAIIQPTADRKHLKEPSFLNGSI